ncbi:MAG: hypothetical protein RJA49_2141, partial [Actinomycetota bacterium]
MGFEPDSASAIAIVGAGPTAASLLERIVANVPTVFGDHPLHIHLVDPHPPGLGRVWRPDNHPGLWMNSLAEDVTLFTDESVVCDGPIVPGPSLHEWAHAIGEGELSALADDALATEIRSLAGTTFPTRRVQSVYLEWFHRRVADALPPNVELIVHRRTAIDLHEEAGRDVITLDDGELVVADAVVLALGHLDATPDAAAQRFADAAVRHRLTYLAAGHTAELDLSVLHAGEDVIVSGFGQAFTDLVVLVTEGRGGRFVTRSDGTLQYVASGREPILHVGSRRGVPYRSKLDYRLLAPRAPLPQFFDDRAIEDLLAAPGPLDFRRDVLPLVDKEVGWAYYHELFHAHGDRVAGPWPAFAAEYSNAHGHQALRDVVARWVPDDSDRWNIEALDTPLAARRFESADAAHHHICDHVRGDVARRTDARYSADLGAFNALLATFAAIGRIAASGGLTPRSRVEDVGDWWFSFFMYFASGPPPARLRQLLALEAAGLVRFLGPGLHVEVDERAGAFVATSSAHPGTRTAGALVDARIAPPSVSRAADR